MSVRSPRMAPGGSSLLLGLLLTVLFGVLIVPASAAFHHGVLAWQTCESGFYDPLFPDVCLQCTDALCVAVTLRAAFFTRLETSSPMLATMPIDVENYNSSRGETRLFRLMKNRGVNSPDLNEARIGYREGLGDLSLPPDVTDASKLPFQTRILPFVMTCCQRWERY